MSVWAGFTSRMSCLIYISLLSSFLMLKVLDLSKLATVFFSLCHSTMAAMDKLDDLQEQVERLEKWLWKTDNWLKEFYQEYGEETHSYHILKKIDTLKDDMTVRIQALESDMKAMKTMKGMKAMKGRKRLKEIKDKKNKKDKKKKGKKAKKTTS